MKLKVTVKLAYTIEFKVFPGISYVRTWLVNKLIKKELIFSDEQAKMTNFDVIEIEELK